MDTSSAQTAGPSQEGRRAIGRRIRDLRIAAGLSQAELGAPAYTGSYISRIEAGQRDPIARVLEFLADRLNTTPDHLRTGVSTDEATDWAIGLRFAQLALGSGNPDEAERRFVSLLDHPAAARSPERTDALWGLASAYEAQGRLDDAVATYEQVRKSTGPGTARSVDVAIALCRCHREAGDMDLAIAVGEQAALEAERAELPDSEASVRLAVTLLSAYHERGDVSHASRLAQAAIERAERLGSRTARAAAYWNYSEVARAKGRLDDAIRYADSAVVLLAEDAEERMLARLRIAYARLLTRQGHVDQALTQLAIAESAIEDGPGSRVDLGYVAVERARAVLTAGEAADAVREAERALDLLGEEALLERADAVTVRGRARLLDGATDAAVDDLMAAAGVLAASGVSRDAASLWAELGDVFDGLGRVDAARDAFKAAAACAGVVNAGALIPDSVSSGAHES